MVVCPPMRGTIPRLLWPSTAGMMSIDGKASVSSHGASFDV
jgi:hypothetical protein